MSTWARYTHMLNNVQLIGRLTKDAKTMATKNSKVFITYFTVAVNPIAKDAPATFVDVKLFSTKADAGVIPYLAKGRQVLVDARFQNNNYTDDKGVKHYDLDIVANFITLLDSAKANTEVQEVVEVEDVFEVEEVVEAPKAKRGRPRKDA